MKRFPIVLLVVTLFLDGFHANQARASEKSVMATYDIEIRPYQFEIGGCINVSYGIPIVIRNRSVTTINSVPVMSIDVTDTAWETLSVSIDPGDSAIVYLSDSIRKPNTGTYLIRVILDTLDDNQSNNIANILYNFQRTPVPAFKISEACYLDTTVFTNQTNTSGFDPVSYKWLFGTGDTALTQHAKYRYTIDDTFTTQQFEATLISRVEGCRDSTVHTAIVKGLPDASFTAETVGHDLVILSQATSAPENTYVWDFGDGSGSNEITPSHTYDKPGTYQVCLTVVSTFNCRNKTCVNVTYSTGIDEIDRKYGTVHLIPNPANGMFRISGVASMANDEHFRVTVISQDGRELMVYKKTTGLGTADLQPGLYFVRISGSKADVVLPLVVCD